PWEINFNPAIKHGTTEERTIHSKIVNADYQLRIYLPPDYNTKQQERLPSAYFQDGNDYIVLGSAINVIDNLLDSNKIRRLIAIFVQPNNRNEEYALSQRHLYREFFVKELVPFIDSVYRTIKSPSDRLVLGDSYGGNISTLISFMHPDVFGNLGNHSGAFQTNNYEAAGVMLSPPKRAVRQYAVWGTYEMLYQPWRVYTDSLRANGYDYKWAEYPEGHSWGLWRGTLDDILKFIFPSPATGVSDETLSEKSIGSGSYKLRQNYPNPFNNSTKISYEISAPAYVSLDIYNLMGEKVTTIYSGNKDSGVHYSDFNGKDDKGSYLPSGIYFARLNVFQGSNRSDRFYSVSNKMILLK
ncbi:MAG: alpha/beta hydrolase-fold protein, partial [Bacillota bacterium]